ncbi:hypothetical protein ACG3SL_05310 [Sphingomonas sp. CJ20]
MAGAFLASDWGSTNRCIYWIEDGAAARIVRGDRDRRAGTAA